MRLKELQKMIKEEFDNYMEQPEMGDVDVSVDPGMDIDAMGGEEGADAEGTLRNIYDLLTAYFEGGEEEDMEDIETDDVEGGEDEEADIEENSTKEAKYQKTGYAPGGKGSTKNAPYVKSAKGGGSTKNAGYDASSKALQEVKRFQKLANIIK